MNHPRCLLLSAVLIAGSAGCTSRTLVKFDPSYEYAGPAGAPLPMKVGLLMPAPEDMPPGVFQTRCAFGKDIVTVHYGEEYGRAAYQALSKRFKSAVLLAQGDPLGDYDAVVAFEPPKLTAAPNCAMNYLAFWQIWPLFIGPISGNSYDVEVGASLLDSGGRQVAAGSGQASASPGMYSSKVQGAVSDAVSGALADVIGKPEFIRYRRTKRQARVAAPERLGDAAAQEGRAAQALARYQEAYRAAREDDEARDRILGKLFDAVRLMEPPPPVTAEAQGHADRAEALLRRATDARGFGKAADHLRQAIELAPWWAEAYFNLGLTLEKAGDGAGAARALKLFLQARPDSPEAVGVQQKLADLDAALELSGGGSAYEGTDEEPAPAPSAPARATAGGKRKKTSSARP